MTQPSRASGSASLWDSSSFVGLLIVAGLGAEVAPKTFVEKIGNFIGYFDRILNLDSGKRVWTDPAEWFWGWKGWLKLLAETLLLSYVGTSIGAVGAFCLNFFAASNVSPHPVVRFVVRRLMEFCRTVPGIVFALIFVIAFGLGPMLVCWPLRSIRLERSASSIPNRSRIST